MSTVKKTDFIKKRLGAFKSPWDPRNFRVPEPTLEQIQSLPESYDGLLQFHDPDWYDQGDVGSCVGWDNMIVMEITNYLLDGIEDKLSASFIYNWSRHFANVPSWQEGSTNDGAMKALNKYGVCTIDYVPEDITSPYEYIEKPGAFENAAQFMIDSYWYVNLNPSDMKAAIYGITHPMPYNMPDGSPGKVPLVTAFPVYESFQEAYDDGIVPTPKAGERLLGGHSSCIRGWKVIDGQEYFINTNSWGKEVGDNGTFYIPVSHPFYDAWVIHNGPCVPEPPPSPTPSVCPVGNGIAKGANTVMDCAARVGRATGIKQLSRRGRFFYLNPQ